MDEIIKKYRQWKKDHPDKDYQYDEIHDFYAELSREEMQEVMEAVEKKFSK